MSKPTILTVDDDPQVAAAIGRDLAGQYGAEYRAVQATSGTEGLMVVARRPRGAEAGGWRWCAALARRGRRAGGDDRRRPADASDARDRAALPGAGPRPWGQ